MRALKNLFGRLNEKENTAPITLHLNRILYNSDQLFPARKVIFSEKP